MKHEDEMARRDAEANHRAIYGDDPNQKGSEDEMGHIVLGDYRIDQHLPQPAQSQQTSESPGLLKKALAIGLAVAAGTSPLGIGAYFLADKLQQPQPVVQPEAKTEVIEKPIGFTVGDPIVE